MGMAVKWVIRGIFILMPLIGGTVYVLYLGFIYPLFFGDGISDMVSFFTEKETLFLMVQLPILYAVNRMYTPILDRVCRLYWKVEYILIEAVDRRYDKLLCGSFGRGDSSIVEWICVISYLACFIVGSFSAFIIMGYVIYDGLANLSFSWSAWMKFKYAERITFKWIPLIALTMLFLRPALHLIDRPMRGYAERVIGYLKDKSKS